MTLSNGTVQPRFRAELQAVIKKVETLSKKMFIPYKSDRETQIKSMPCAMCYVLCAMCYVLCAMYYMCHVLLLMTVSLNGIFDLVQH